MSDTNTSSNPVPVIPAVTFTKLNDAWCLKGVGTALIPGTSVSVTKKDSTTKNVKINVILQQDGETTWASFIDDSPVPMSKKGKFLSKKTAKASFSRPVAGAAASLSAPLAIPEAVNEPNAEFDAQFADDDIL